MIAASSGAEGLEKDEEDGARKGTHHINSVGKLERSDEPRRKCHRKEEKEGSGAYYKEDNSMDGNEGGRVSENDPLPPQTTTAAVHVEFWDKLR